MPNDIDVVLRVRQAGARAIDKTKKDLIGLNKRLEGFAKQARKVRHVALAIGVVATATGFLAKNTITAASKMQDFRVQLQAIASSADEADQQLQKIRKFARESPLETEDTVTAFVQLRAVGIQPTMEAMKVMGGVAVLMRRDLTDVAGTLISMEKETLRRFGIEIDRTGSKAIIMSGNIRKTVNKDAASIRRAVLETWQERFPDAMKLAQETTSSRVAVMKSELFELSAQIGQGLTPAFNALVDVIGKTAGKIRELRISDELVDFYRTIFGPTTTEDIRLKRLVREAEKLQDTNKLFERRLELTTELTRKEQGLDSLRKKIAGESRQRTRDTMTAALKRTEKQAFKTRTQIESLRQAMARINTEQREEAKIKGLGDLGGGGEDEQTEAERKKAEAARNKFRKSQEKAHKEQFESRQKEAEAVWSNEQKITEIRHAAALERAELIQGDRERELLILKMNQEREIQELAGNKAQIFEIEKLHNNQITNLEQEHADRRARAQIRLNEQVAQSRKGLATTLAQVGREVTNASIQSAKKRRNVLAGIAIAEAAAGAVSGVASAMKLSWPLNLISAATAVAEVAALTIGQISAIKNSSFWVGTVSAPGGSALVGEKGPEIAYIPRGARIDTAASTRNQQYTTNNNNGGNTLNVSAITDERLLDTIRSAMRNGKAENFLTDLSVQLATRG